MNIKYVDKRFGPSGLAMIEVANRIIKEYQAQGFDLTLRQLYYQFVSRDLIANEQKEYKRLGSIINDARLAGLISWESIIDRTRNLESNSHWSSPRDIVSACANQYQIDKWAGMENYVEVWIEKDALIGVIEKICHGMDVPYFSCRGYTSQSEMWSASQRFLEHAEEGRKIIVIHLGDHDPSGKDMTRDIEDRIGMFLDTDFGSSGTATFEVKRIALNMDQVRKYKPPPNPAKITDSRARNYIKEFGRESWELDALDPRTIHKLIESTVLEYRDEDVWEQNMKMQTKHRAEILKAAQKIKE